MFQLLKDAQAFCVCVQVKLRDQPDGYEFSIKTPVTPPRWQDYDKVMPAASASVVDKCM